MRAVTTFKTLSATLAGVMASGMAFAQDTLPKLPSLGKPGHNGISLQAPGTEVMENVIWYDDFLLWIVGAITVFVTALLLIVIFKFNEKRNAKAATFTHNSALEVAWTLIPILILISMIPFSLNLLFKQEEIPVADLTIKATGNQWYWSYEYVDSEFGFDSFMLAKDELEENGFAPDEYLLATDTSVVVPTGKIVVVQITGADVIHSWAVPAFGVKQDAVPGRLAEVWFRVDEGKEGVYFGQCSELCGKDHSYMPITVKAVSQADYDKWLVGAKEEYAGVPSAKKVASADIALIGGAQAAE